MSLVIGAGLVQRLRYIRIMISITIFLVFFGLAAYVGGELHQAVGARILLGIGILLALIFDQGVVASGASFSWLAVRQVGWVLVPLGAMIVVNGAGTPLHDIDLQRIDAGEVIAAIIWEEALFRGVMLNLWAGVYDLKSKLSRVLYIVLISGALFAFLHPGQDISMFWTRFGLGTTPGMIRLQSHSLLYGLLLHAFNNSLFYIAHSVLSIEIQHLVLLLLGIACILIVVRDNSYGSSKSS